MLNPSIIFIKLKQFGSKSLFGTIFGTVGLNIIVNKACPKPKGTRGQMLI